MLPENIQPRSLPPASERTVQDGCDTDLSRLLTHCGDDVRPSGAERWTLVSLRRSLWLRSSVSPVGARPQHLEAAGEKFRLKLVQLESLGDMAEHLRQVAIGAATA